MKKISLNREQLKIIAIIAMVIDHSAWGFLDFYTPLAQFLHVIGRLTIPIMCFFVVEGFRKTSDLKAYITRLTCFALVAVIPFYIFFHEEYDYRQNFFFDLLIGLLVLTTLESTLKKWQKILLATLLFLISGTIGGWPLTPTLFMLSFYYGKTFREKVKWFIISDLSTVGFLVCAITLNSIYHFSHYEWVWWDKFYLLGFMLALPLLYCYNGEKGRDIFGRYFFYCFYPIHFLILATIKFMMPAYFSAYDLYLYVHIASLILLLIFLFLSLRSKPSHGQVAIIIFEFAATTYVFGFILEILSSTVEGYHLACIVEYFGEYLVILSLTYFIRELCFLNIPLPVYVAQIIYSLIGMYQLITTLTNGFFYRSVGVDISGPFPRLTLEYGPGFYMTISYIAIFSFFMIAACLRMYRQSSEIGQKRIQCILIALCFVWLPYLIKLTGITGGYEIPALGITGAAVAMYLALSRYGFLDSITLASENALDHGLEGILVLNTQYKIQYHNQQIDTIFGALSHNMDLREHPLMRDIVLGQLETFQKDDRIYDLRIEPLLEAGFIHGYMIWVLDSTEHHAAMKRIQELADHDALTMLHNRSFFQKAVSEDLEAGRPGTLIMFDMDDFKHVNDAYGHRVGDDVLIAFASVLKEYPDEVLLKCRLGGDEFCAFLRDNADPEKTASILQTIMDRFALKLMELDYEGYTSLSAGAVLTTCTQLKVLSFETLYSLGDKALYESKNTGKNRYSIYQ